jgi:predicted SAM-dependent methyltransferase
MGVRRYLERKLLTPLVDFSMRGRRAKHLRQLGSGPRRLVVGASGIDQDGWIPTDQSYLDLLKPRQWRRYFEPGSLHAVFAEHVWEHLTPEEALTAARTCAEFLAAGGYVRVAVPDGLNPDPAYIAGVRPGGTGAGADDHKVLYTYRTLSEVFERAGFRVRLLEYFDEAGQFHAEPWDVKDGLVRRSARFDPRNTDGKLVYTSVILDATK